MDVNLYLADSFLDLLNNPPTIVGSLRTSSTGYYISSPLTAGSTYTIIFSVDNDNYSMSLFDLSTNLYSKSAPNTIDGRLVDPVVPLTPVHYGAFNSTTPTFTWNVYTGNALTDSTLPAGNASADLYQILIWEIQNGILDQLVLTDYSNTVNYTIQASSALSDGMYAYEVAVIDFNYAGSGQNLPLAWFDYHNIFYVAVNPPQVTNAYVVADNQIDVEFNENVTPATANTPGNYTVNPGNIHPVSSELDSINQDYVRLTFAGDFNPDTYTLTVMNVTDLDGLPVQLSGINSAQFVVQGQKQGEIFEDLSSVIVYPNPVREIKLLTFKNLTEEGEIDFYSIAGELILTEKYYAANNGILTIDLSNSKISSGVYIYHIKDTKNGDSKTGKFALLK